MNDYRVLLYYLYTNIENPEEFTKEHLSYCKNLGVLGRINISSEGINGTISGTVLQTETYMKDLKSDQRFKDIVFKIDEAEEHAFKKMHVRNKKELVTLRLENDINPLVTSGKKLKPIEWFNAMQDEDYVLIDARNDYEYDLGHFRGSIRPDIKYFRQLPEWIKENREKFKSKKILAFCTGGVRCEKFTGWLLNEGYEDVSQLDGGISTYSKDEKTKGALWDGKMYVFDNRISVPINRHEHIIVGRDYFTNEPCERYINCGNPSCNKQILASEESEYKYLGACSNSCRTNPRNRYVINNKLTKEEVLLRLSKIGE